MQKQVTTHTHSIERQEKQTKNPRHLMREDNLFSAGGRNTFRVGAFQLTPVMTIPGAMHEYLISHTVAVT